MVHLVFHGHGVAEGAVAVRAQGQPVGLVLQRLERVQVAAVGVDRRMDGVGAGVAGGAEQAAAVVGARPEQVVRARGPQVEGGVGLRRLEVRVAVEAVRLIDKGAARQDLLDALHALRPEVGHEYPGPRLAVLLLLSQEA